MTTKQETKIIYTRTRKITAKLFCMLSFFFCASTMLISPSQAFVVSPRSTTTPSTRSRQHSKTTADDHQRLGMLVDAATSTSDHLLAFLDEPKVNILSQLVEVTAPALPSVSSIVDEEKVVTTTLVLTPDREAEVLTDVSHVIMDFPDFLRIPSKSLIRMYSVIGRILVILADYLPDHSIRPEELAIQIFLLAVSVKDVLRTLPSCSLEEEQDSNGSSTTK